ncbi:MAG: BolA family protein [Mangrovicoccus sp.]
MSVAQEIREKLEAAFTPERLEVVDESEAHAGHSGYQDGGESHFRVLIKAESLEGKNRLGRHRAIHAAIGQDTIDRIHALAIEMPN